MADLELPAYRPVYPISKNVKPRQIATKSPSQWGIEQRKTVGQNQTAPEWNIKWVLQDDDADILDEFLYNRARNNEYFLWAPPGYQQAKYRCDSWTKTRIDLDVSDIQATFKRIYDYNNLISFDAENGHFAFDGYNASFDKDKYIAANRGLFEVNELLLDEFPDLVDSLSNFDEAYEIGASFNQTHIIYIDSYQLVLTGGSFSVQFGVASDYFSSFNSQVYGWDRDFQVDWWAD